MKVLIVAESDPKNSLNWARSFNVGQILDFDNLEVAQKWVDEQCAMAGTDKDPNYELYAPVAVKYVD